MQNSTIVISNERFTPDPFGALYWLRESTLIVSDLHLEKGSRVAEKDGELPLYDTRTTLKHLSRLMRRYRPKQVICLGDAFHDQGAERPMEEEYAQSLEALMGSTQWVWVLGNHGQQPPSRFSAPSFKELKIGPITFRHEPLSGHARGEIAGYLHPCARVAAEGRILRRRCFATGDNRVILPAMGAFTGGLNLLDDAFEGLFINRCAWVMGEEGVYPILENSLAPDITMGARRQNARV